MQRVLVSGCAGFIGGHLTEELLKQGYKVIGVDHVSRGYNAVLKQLLSNPNFVFYETDLSITSDIEQIEDSFDACFHVAFNPKVQYSNEYPKETEYQNMMGFLNVLELCKSKGCKTIIFSSSSGVYGANNQVPQYEDITPLPESAYAIQKLSCEHYLRVYSRLHGFKYISLRYYFVFGPRQNSLGIYAPVIPKFIVNALKGENLQLVGDGKQEKDFVYVKDVVTANLAALNCTNLESWNREYNIASGQSRSVQEIAQQILKNTNSISELVYLPSTVEPQRVEASISLASRLLAWSPHYGFEDALKETIDWYKEELRNENA